MLLYSVLQLLVLAVEVLNASTTEEDSETRYRWVYSILVATLQ